MYIFTGRECNLRANESRIQIRANREIMSKPSSSAKRSRRLARFIFSRLNSLEKQIRGTYVRVSSAFDLDNKDDNNDAGIQILFMLLFSRARIPHWWNRTGFRGRAGERDPQETTLVSERLSGSNKYRRS